MGGGGTPEATGGAAPSAATFLCNKEDELLLIVQQLQLDEEGELMQQLEEQLPEVKELFFKVLETWLRPAGTTSAGI